MLSSMLYGSNDTSTAPWDVSVSNATVGNIKKPSERDFAYLWIYVSPFILVTGIFGNVLTLLVMNNKRLRGTTVSVYLSAMAVADSLALLFRIPPEFFEAVGYTLGKQWVFSELNRYTCKLEKFAFYAASDLAIWILVAFTIDRLVAVYCPLRKHTLCAPGRAAIVCVSLAVVAVAKNVHVFWTRGEEHDKQTLKLLRVCGRPREYRYFEDSVRPWLAFVLVSVVPFVIIILSNCLIIHRLVRAHRVRHQALTVRLSSGAVVSSSAGARTSGGDNVRTSGGMSNESGGGVNGNYPTTALTAVCSAAAVGALAAPTADEDRVKAASAAGTGLSGTTTSSSTSSVVFTQTSLMCLGASLAFLVCVTPSIVLTLGRQYWIASTDTNVLWSYYFARAVSHQLACMNHAVNFFMYCIAGQRFRAELKNLLRRNSRRRGSSATLDASTRRYYMDTLQARRSAAASKSTAVFVMQTMALSAPAATSASAAVQQANDDDDDLEALSET